MPQLPGTRIKLTCQHVPISSLIAHFLPSKGSESYLMTSQVKYITLIIESLLPGCPGPSKAKLTYELPLIESSAGLSFHQHEEQVHEM